MTNDSTVVPLRQPEGSYDPLTAVLRAGARRLLAEAVEAEAEAFLAAMKGLRLPDGRSRRRSYAGGRRPVFWLRLLPPQSGDADAEHRTPLHRDRRR